MQRAMFQCLLGIEAHDFVMIAADKTNTQSIFILNNDEDKIMPLEKNIMMGVTGDIGDIVQFSQFINKNMALYRKRNGYQLSSTAAVHFTRKNLADSLRTGFPYLLNLLVGGYDETTGGQLHYLDNMASCVRVPYAAHGFGGLFALSILEYYYKPTLTEAEAYEVMLMCVREIHTRLFMNLPNFQVKVVDKEGVRTLPVICPQTFFTKPAPAAPAPPVVATEDSNNKQRGDIKRKRKAF